MPLLLHCPAHLPGRFHFSTRSDVSMAVLAVSVQSVMRHPLSTVLRCSSPELIASQLHVSGSRVGNRCEGSVPMSFWLCIFRQYAYSPAKLLQLSWSRYIASVLFFFAVPKIFSLFLQKFGPIYWWCNTTDKCLCTLVRSDTQSRPCVVYRN